MAAPSESGCCEHRGVVSTSTPPPTNSTALLNVGNIPTFPQSLLITSKCLKRHSKTIIHKPPPNEVLTRLKSFLPKLANANELLSRKIENASSDDFDIENVREDTEVIEMNIALFPAVDEGEEEEVKDEEEEEEEEEEDEDEDDSFTDDLSFHGLKEADETVFDKVTKTNLRLEPVKMDYTIQDKAELVLLHARGLSQRETCQAFHHRHPTKPMPQQGIVSKLMKRFRETGSVADKRRSGRPRSSTDPDHTIDVLANVVVSPDRSTRKIGEESGISHMSVARILKRNKCHP